jgi:hypothetical protein
MVIMSAHSQTRRVTHLTLIDARVVSGFMENVFGELRNCSGKKINDLLIN